MTSYYKGILWYMIDFYSKKPFNKRDSVQSIITVRTEPLQGKKEMPPLRVTVLRHPVGVYSATMTGSLYIILRINPLITCP